MKITIPKNTLRDEALLFSESNTRFVVEVMDEDKFLNSMKGLPVSKLGVICPGRSFKIFASTKRLIVNTTIDKLKAAWQAPFKSF